MGKIVFIAKTNLNNDGRILNQIRILQNKFIQNLDLHFLLLPDKPYDDNLGVGVTIHNLNTSFRNNKFFRLFTVIQFTYKALKKLINLKPDIIHVHDMAIVLPIYIYKKYYSKNTIVIYDDHEMPNENETFEYRILQYFETKLMHLANQVITANQERQEVLEEKLKFNKISYFLNLPYFDEEMDKSKKDIEQKYYIKLKELIALKRAGTKLIIHQGALEIERGRKKIADFSKNDLKDTKIMIIGITEAAYNLFIQEYNLNKVNFFYVGSVPYKILKEFWKLGDAAIIMYLPTYINNRLCAPNRYFIALELGIPTIVNKDNPVLFNFTEKYKSGFYIENIVSDKEIEHMFLHSYHTNILAKLKKVEISKFESFYEKFI